MSSNIINLLWESFLETILMVGVSGGLGAAIGIPLGVFLFVTSPKGIMPKPYVNRIIGTIVNAVRSTPFIILLVAIIPFTRLIGLFHRYGCRHRPSDDCRCSAHRSSGRNQSA